MANILALDDELEACFLIKRILSPAHEVSIFTEEDQAIAHAENHPVDLAILDIKLKKMSGVEVLSRLRDIDPDIRVIMLTGYPTLETAREAMSLGAYEYLIKPIDIEELERKVADVIEAGDKKARKSPTTRPEALIDTREVYSLCFMCSVRCPIKVTVEGDDVKYVEGNPHVPGMEGSLCARGNAGIALLHDRERLQQPMIRTGPRGSGQWRNASWDEALEYTADKLKGIIDNHGGQSIVLGERTNLNTHLSKALLRAIGSPNHFTHDALCKGSVNTAGRSIFGYTDAQMTFDYKKTRHIVFYGRNFFETMEVKAVNSLMSAVENGARITYIDPRVSITATKADRYWMIRPGTDLAVNYALIHVILEEALYDKAFVDRWVQGFDELSTFVKPYSPEWAETETGIPVEEIVSLARDVAECKPSVIFHFGYRGAHHTNEIYLRRSIMILSSLLGAVEAEGGLVFKKGPKDLGLKGPKKCTDLDLPDLSVERFDGVGTTKFPLPDPAHGVGQMLPYAILNEDPYPIKALIANRFDPLLSIPDMNQVRQALDKLDLIVTIDINFGETAWYSDVILPESTYFERTDSIQVASGLKPQLFIRKQAIPPLHDTRPGWLIMKDLADRLGVGDYLPFRNEEEFLRFQLEGTEINIEDFLSKGFVPLTDKQILWDRQDGIKFKTPSGRIEFVSTLLEEHGYKSFPAYEPMASPPEGFFRLIVGRCAVHTHVSTQNNPILNEMIPENVLWVHPNGAKNAGVRDGEMVEVSSEQGTQKIRAHVTEQIHPEAVFMLHGFGRQVPVQTRSYQKGANDNVLLRNVSDPIGGSPGLHETFVSIRPLARHDQ
jgi:thiosulfate reductase/polysulfide reductase chain A